MSRSDLNTRTLADVDPTLPADNEVLAWDAAAGQYVPTEVTGLVTFPTIDLTDIVIDDDDANAFRVREAGNNYIHVDTSNTGASISLGNATTNPRVQTVGSGYFRVGSGVIDIPNATAGALVFIDESLNNYISLSSATGPYGPLILLGNTTNNPDFFWDSGGAWYMNADAGTSGQVFTSNGTGGSPTWEDPTPAFDPTDVPINASLSGALRIHDGTQDWLRFNTGTAAIILGNTTDNPAVTFLGSGAMTLTTGGISVPDNSATAFRILEGANSYLTTSTENAGAYMLFGNATTNPEYGFQGTGTFAIGSSGSNRFISIDGAANYSALPVVLGAGFESSATPSDGTLRVTDGAGTDIAGADLILRAGLSTGDEPGGSLLFQSSVPAASSATPNAAATLWELDYRGAWLRTGNQVFGSVTSFPSGTGILVMGTHTSATAMANNDKVILGRSSGSNANARVVSITAAGRTGTAGADSVAIMPSNGVGVTGNTSNGIGGAVNITGTNSNGLGYGVTLAHDHCAGFGRGATSTAAGQFIVGGDARPITDLYIGEGVTEAGGFAATAITIQPTEGTGANRAGLPITIRGGRGTGTGNAGATAGSFTVETYPAGSTGTTAHTATPRLRVRADGTTLFASHADMSDAQDRDEAVHRQTGSVAFTAAGTHTILTITPESTNGFYHARVRLLAWGYDTVLEEYVLMTLWGEVSWSVFAGVATIGGWYSNSVGEPPNEDGGAGEPWWATASGGSIIIQLLTADENAGRAVASVEWQGTQVS